MQRLTQIISYAPKLNTHGEAHFLAQLRLAALTGHAFITAQTPHSGDLSVERSREGSYPWYGSVPHFSPLPFEGEGPLHLRVSRTKGIR
jgi:hypothetical protein